jgi:hypothetical protein
MTFVIERRSGFGDYDHKRLPPTPQQVLAGTALGVVAILCAWVTADFVGMGADRMDDSAGRGDRLDLTASNSPDRGRTRGDKLAVRSPNAMISNSYASLFDPRIEFDRPLPVFVSTGAFERDDGPVSASPSIASPTIRAASIPQSPTRTTRLAAISASAQAMARSSRNAPRERAQDSPPESNTSNRSTTILGSIFEKLFGKPASLTLAYAATDDAGLGTSKRLTGGRYDQWTAVYDISAHTVYMPNGTQLEAHSGLGSRLDDPRYADEKMHGVTPPNVYDLEPRESPFHGVRALRMIPQDQEKTFGRSGLLAHTYMLGPNGDSNGCVSFKNYDAFLQAYLNHEVKRIAVVARLD